MEIRRDSQQELAAPHFSLLPNLEELNNLLKIVDDDEVSFEQLALRMEYRSHIAAAMIRTANSAGMGSLQQARSLRHALAMLGLQHIRVILLKLKDETIADAQRASA